MGPVEYIVVSFPGNDFTGRIAPELVALVESGTVRVLDLLFIGKDAEGDVLAFEIDELEDLAGFDQVPGEVGGLIGPEDIEFIASQLEPNSSAALLIWEDIWAAPFAKAVLDSGGVLLQGARIPHAVIEAALDGLPSAV
jgi:Family of unknown function (DUF6325)